MENEIYVQLYSLSLKLENVFHEKQKMWKIS